MQSAVLILWTAKRWQEAMDRRTHSWPRGAGLLALGIFLLWLCQPAAACPHKCTCHRLAVHRMSTADCMGKSLVTVPRARGGEKHLQVVDLSGNRLRTLPDDAFGVFPSLKYLFLSDNLIQVVNQYAFRGVPDLEVLYLSENGLTSLPPNLFEGCMVLWKVVLRGNPVLRLLPPALPPPPGAIVPPSHPDTASSPQLPPFLASQALQELDVSGCGVDFIPNEAFSALPRLKKLNLSSNALSEVDPRSLGPLCSLTNLDLTGNRIQCGCSTARLSRWIRERRVEVAKMLMCSRAHSDDEIVVNENEAEKMSQSISTRCDMLLLMEERLYAGCQAAIAEAEELQRHAVETKKTWITVGCVAAGVLILFLLILWVFRRRLQKKRMKEEKAARAAAEEKNGLDHQPLRDDADG